MSSLNRIFERIHNITHEEGQSDFISVFLEQTSDNDAETVQPNIDFEKLTTFLHKIFREIDSLSVELKKDSSILISVRNQKLLRTCFQLVSSLGFSLSLIPGLGISLDKRCTSSAVLPSITLSDEQKYELLTACTDFFTRCYVIPVLKNIILTFHMSDYLAALIQLSFAPLKKPGTYKDFVMSEEMYKKLNMNRQKYVPIYEHLVAHCFQPILMKELLVLQSVVSPTPPMFVKRIITKELSRRLLAPGGLLSLIRCFIDSYNIDSGLDWKKINMICKIIGTKHSNDSEECYLQNICSQIMQILTLNNVHYLTTGVACALSLYEKYQESEPVKLLIKEMFQTFQYEYLLSKCDLPGTVILSSQEIDYKVNILHACVSNSSLECPISLLTPSIDIVFLLGVQCTKNKDLQNKIKDILLKCFGQLNKDEMERILKKFLFGNSSLEKFDIIEFESGLTIKCVSNKTEQSTNAAMPYFINLFEASTENLFVQNTFESSLKILNDLISKRRSNTNKETLILEEEELILNVLDEQYANMLQLLSEISTSPKLISALKQNPSIVLHFIEFIITNNQPNCDEESTSIALVLLNMILSNSNDTPQSTLNKLTPFIKKMSESNSGFDNILCKEALSLISSKKSLESETACGKAIKEVFDELLPVRAHGIMELTKLIDTKDPETISKKHYIFCLLQEQLKDSDTYIYLAAINGLAALGTHCTEDVIQVLCKEFLQGSTEVNSLLTNDDQNKIAERRMKIGDVIVKVTRKLGEMAIVHKSILLNTMLCGCRDPDPLLRTSALSNLAEIVLVLHYKVGSIIYEILLCIWGVIESDKAVECRRAAVMVISSLLKGLGQDTLVQLKENILPIYRTLKRIYSDANEDSVVRLHAQIALEELNVTVTKFMFPELKTEKQIFVLNEPENHFK